jgi:hypothetical protein
MAKDRTEDSTQPMRRNPTPRGGSSIRDEGAYITETKARLGDERVLREHATRHLAGAADQCALKNGRCHSYLPWLVLDLLNFYEKAVLFGPKLRELRAAVTDFENRAKRCIAILDDLIPRGIDGAVLEIARGYFESQRDFDEKMKSLLFESATGDPLHELLAEQPLHRFRELATMVLGLAGYSYQEIADLVDRGDRDRMRKSPAWRAVVDEYKRQGKCAPTKSRIRLNEVCKPNATSMTRPATPAVATAARAERTAATRPRPPVSSTAKPRASERRVEQVEHLVGQPVFDQDLDGRPNSI